MVGDPLGTEEFGFIFTPGSGLVEPFNAAIAQMKADPARFGLYNPPNGWGSYEVFVPWLEAYLSACESYPDATVRVSR